MKACVVGGGSWGSAFAVHLGRIGIPTHLWIREEEIFIELTEQRTNSVFLPGFVFPPQVDFFNDIAAALEGCEIVFVAVPSAYFRNVFIRMAPHANKARGIVSLTKGLEEGTRKRMSEIVEEVLAPFPLDRRPVAALSGPSFAREVAQGQATAVVIASEDMAFAGTVQHLVSNLNFRAYTSPDINGVELAGAVKNVIAIAAGLADGLDAGRNSLAALMTRGIYEMTRLGLRMGARPETFSGLAGIGDLILTCTGALSRNHYVGFELGRGRSLEAIKSGMTMVAEGIATTLSVRELSERLQVEMPICDQVYEVLYRGKPLDRVLGDLMSRSLKSEHGNLFGPDAEEKE